MNDRAKEKTTAITNSLHLRLKKLRELDPARAAKIEPEVHRALGLLKKHGERAASNEEADLAFSNVSSMLDQRLVVAEMAKEK